VGIVCTFTQGGWGTICHGRNPGCIRDANFAKDFPSGLSIGGDKASALWTSSEAIRAYLPAGGTPRALEGQLTDSRITAAGVLAGQQVAAKLNVGLLHAPASYVFVGCVEERLVGATVGSVIAMADKAMSSGLAPPGLTFAELSAALAVFNENYDECRNSGCLAPSIVRAPTPRPLFPIGAGRRKLPDF
jgi:hypothetical protein